MPNLCYVTITMVDGSSIPKPIMDFILEKWDKISRRKEMPNEGDLEVYISSYVYRPIYDFISELAKKSDGIKTVYTSDIDLGKIITGTSKNGDWVCVESREELKSIKV